MMFFGMLAGWLVLSCLTAPLIGNCLRSAGPATDRLAPATDRLAPAVDQRAPAANKRAPAADRLANAG
jgi:hypothetical protein